MTGLHFIDPPASNLRYPAFPIAGVGATLQRNCHPFAHSPEADQQYCPSGGAGQPPSAHGSTSMESFLPDRHRYGKNPKKVAVRNHSIQTGN